MSLVYYPSEGGITKVGITDTGDWFGDSTGGKIISKITSYSFPNSINYFNYIPANLTNQSKWFYGNVTEYNFINNKTIYRCVYIGNKEDSIGNLLINNIDVSISSDISSVTNIQDYVEVFIATDGVFTEPSSKNSTVLSREDDPENILSSRDDWTTNIDTSSYNSLKPGEFYKVWIKIIFKNNNNINKLTKFKIKIKGLEIEVEKKNSRLLYSKLFRTSLFNSFDKEKNDFILTKFFDSENFIMQIYKIIENKNLINIFYWKDDLTFNQLIIKPHSNIEKVKIVNLNISNYLKGLRITNQEDINEIVSNVENPPPISGIVGNEILWNIYFPRNEEKLFDKYELFTNKYLCEPLNENDQNVYLIKDYNYIFDENKNYKKYLLNIFSTQIYDENYFYIFYNQYVPAENYQSNKNKKKYGYKEYKLRTFVAILNLTHINDAFFETVENEEEIKIINPTILQLHDVYTCLSIDQYEDVLNGLLIHIDNCSKSKNLTKLFYLWEKDLIFNEPNLHIFDIPQTFNTSFKCPQNKIDSYMSLHFNEKNVNIVNTNFFRKIENLDTNKKYKFINMGSPHQKAFFHGYSPVSFDWKTNQIIDGFCSTIAFGFEKKSLFKLFNESENNCFSDEQFNASATLFSNLDCIQQSNMSKKNEIKNIFIFYNDSYYDKYTKEPSELDFEAIDYTKKPLFFGGKANFENIINTTSGINGIFIDFITINEDNIGINDFTFKLGNDNNLSTWTNAPLPKYFKVFDVYYDNMSLKRVCFIWENNKIQNTWLQITVKNNENTFLQQSKTFFFGHLTGLITSTIENGFFVVNNESKNTLLSYINSIINKGFVSVSNKHDISKNGIVGNEDFLTVNFISQIYNSNNYDYYKLIVLNLEENDTSLEIIKNFENETTYNFLENIPSHWHVKDEIFFNKLKNKNIEIPHVHSLFNLKNESISIFKINCPQQTEDKEILEVGYNFSTKKWKIKYKSNDLITQTEFIEKDNLFCTCENVISINCFTKNVYGCKEKKIICFDIFVNGEKLISLETFSKDFPHNLIIEHNPRSHFSGWISFWEVRKYIEEFFDCYAHLMHRFYSNIAWFSLSEEKENQNLFDEMTNKFLYKRILKIQNCNMYLPHDSIIVPLVLQGSGYDVGNHINKQIRRDVFDFSKIDLTHLDFYFTYEKTSNEISWFVEKYDIEKDLLVIWLKLDGWCGQDIIMYYGNKSLELQNNTPKKLVYDNTIWYGLWDMCNITYAYKHRFMINSLLKNNNNETFIILPENQNQYYLMSIFNNYLFNNINVYKHHYFDILIDDRFMSKENLLKFQDFVKETIRDIKPAFTELRNIDSMYDYKVEGDTNSQNTRFIDENNENVVVPYGSNLPLCNG